MNGETTIRVSTVKPDIPMQASKWLHSQVLLDVDEMSLLLTEIGTFYIYLTGCLLQQGKGAVTQKDFLDKYASYITALKSGKSVDPQEFRAYFSSIFTTSTDHLYAVIVSDGRSIIRPAKPVIQLQSHHFHYSPFDAKFHSMVFGPESVSWGVQFSYPQLYQNPETKMVEKVVESENFPNTKLFHTLQRWIRKNTVPTSFLIDGKTVNVPIRLGKKCLAWVNVHPHLAKKELKISVESNKSSQ